mgnify:CR=1
MMEEEDRTKRRRKDSVNWSDMTSFPTPPPHSNNGVVERPSTFPLLPDIGSPFESWHVQPRYKVS